MAQQPTTCNTCGGMGRMEDGNLCPSCFGTGALPPRGAVHLMAKKLFAVAAEVDSLKVQVDAIKAMLDSQTIGLQKMSSNLDDIMVKLDV